MRDKLIELIKARIENKTWCVSDLADYLIANGVIVLPCKAEDEVWYVEEGFCFSRKISHGRVMHFDIRNMWGLGLTYNVAIQPDKDAFDSRLLFAMFDWIGKEFFLTREEAEAKLKGEKG